MGGLVYLVIIIAHRTWTRSVFTISKSIDFRNDRGGDRRPFMQLRSHIHHVVERFAEGEDRSEWLHGR